MPQLGIWLIIVAGTLLLIGGSAMTASADAKPTGDNALGTPLSDFARAIAYSGEGFGKAGARPTRNNNPGDMIPSGITKPYTDRNDGTYAIFDSAQDGWQALEDQLDLIRRGASHEYQKTMTFYQMANVYAGGDSNWAVNVAKAVGAQPSETIEGYL